ncbi:MAG TPA: hypothetical protein VL403_08265 [Candidatus Kryptonia bacterium]|nr:hypothetical protein [Candidatus Kryptonia bacterium]
MRWYERDTFRTSIIASTNCSEKPIERQGKTARVEGARLQTLHNLYVGTCLQVIAAQLMIKGVTPTAAATAAAPTGTASTRIVDANEAIGTSIQGNAICGRSPCVTSASGNAFTCSAITSRSGGLTGGALALSAPLINGAAGATLISDSVVTAKLVAQ